MFSVVNDQFSQILDSEMIFKTDHRKLAVFDMDETLIHTLYKKKFEEEGGDPVSILLT